MNRLRILLTLVMLFSVLSGFSENRALLIGIGKYDRQKTGWNVIHGDNDVELLRPLFVRCGFNDMTTLVNESAVKKNIVDNLKALATRCKEGDKVYFHFSGHGQLVRDDNHDEGDGNGYDQSIVPYDACRDSRRMNGLYNGQFHLIDDELAPLLNAIKEKIGKKGELFVVVDACYSKGIQKDESTDADPELYKFIRGTNYPFSPRIKITIPSPKPFTKGAMMTVVTACQAKERNFEYKSHSGKMYGSLSYYIHFLLKEDCDFSRWRKSFLEGGYRNYRIFQSSQHPSIEIIE